MLARLALLCFCLSALVPLSAGATSSAARIQDQTDFLNLVEGRELRIGFYGIALQVQRNGKIAGRALGQQVSGTWTWANGAFCRDMTWGSRDIGYNCQAVEQVSSNQLRFISDQGTGDSATFTLR